jgi:hypothetical protein
MPVPGPFRTLLSGLELHGAPRSPDCPRGREGEAPQAPPADQRTQWPSHASRRAISFLWCPICELCQRPRLSGVLKFILYEPILNLEDCMRRREFIAGLGGTAAWPLTARAQQQAERVRRIGALIYFDADGPGFQLLVALLRRELRSLGWIEGRNLQLDVRYGVDESHLRSAAEELMRLAPKLLEPYLPNFSQADEITLKKDNQQMQGTQQYINPVEPSYPEKLLAILARPDLPKVVGVHWVARQLERPWEEIRSNIRASTKVAEGPGLEIPISDWLQGALRI